MVVWVYKLMRKNKIRIIIAFIFSQKSSIISSFSKTFFVFLFIRSLWTYMWCPTFISRLEDFIFFQVSWPHLQIFQSFCLHSHYIFFIGIHTIIETFSYIICWNIIRSINNMNLCFNINKFYESLSCTCMHLFQHKLY